MYIRREDNDKKWNLPDTHSLVHLTPPPTPSQTHLRGPKALVVVGVGQHGLQALQELAAPKGGLRHLLLGGLLDGVP